MNLFLVPVRLSEYYFLETLWYININISDSLFKLFIKNFTIRGHKTMQKIAFAHFLHCVLMNGLAQPISEASQCHVFIIMLSFYILINCAPKHFMVILKPLTLSFILLKGPTQGTKTWIYVLRKLLWRKKYNVFWNWKWNTSYKCLFC